jgi:hypothetical protein
MNSAQFHLMINTLPPIVSCMALVALFFGVWWRSEHLKRFALVLIVAVPLLIIPVVYTGREAVVVIGNLPNVPLDLIGEHEESVNATWIAAGIAGCVAAASLFRYRGSRTLPRVVLILALITTLTADALLIRTAQLGGMIRHPETRRHFEAPTAPQTP